MIQWHEYIYSVAITTSFLEFFFNHPRQLVFINGSFHSPSSCAHGHLCLLLVPVALPHEDGIIRHLPACLCLDCFTLQRQCYSRTVRIDATVITGVWITLKISAFTFVLLLLFVLFWGESVPRGRIFEPSGTPLFNFLRNCQSFCVSLI